SPHGIHTTVPTIIKMSSIVVASAGLRRLMATVKGWLPTMFGTVN
ncbi:MAG: hypothetical protein ACI9WS_003010, partial [Paraglaciecola psychrophila]